MSDAGEMVIGFTYVHFLFSYFCLYCVRRINRNLQWLFTNKLCEVLTPVLELV